MKRPATTVFLMLASVLLLGGLAHAQYERQREDRPDRERAVPLPTRTATARDFSRVETIIAPISPSTPTAIPTTKTGLPDTKAATAVNRSTKESIVQLS